MHSLSDALLVPFVPVQVYRHSYAPPRCRTSQYRKTFISPLVSVWNEFVDSVFYSVRFAGFKGYGFFVGLICSLPFRFILFYLSLPSF